MVRRVIGLSRLKDGGWYWTVFGAGFSDMKSSCPSLAGGECCRHGFDPDNPA